MHNYFCSECGASLDPGERCDCKEKEKAVAAATTTAQGANAPTKKAIKSISRTNKKSKYHSIATCIDGIEFDSRKEARRYQELKLLEKAGRISNLEMQVPFELVPAQYEECNEVYTRGPRKGERKRGACIEKAVIYRADFVYIEDGKIVAEDTKGFKTKDYIIKRKLMLWVHKIRIKEI